MIPFFIGFFGALPFAGVLFFVKIAKMAFRGGLDFDDKD